MMITEIFERFDGLLKQVEKGKPVTGLQLGALKNATLDFSIEKLEQIMSLYDDIRELQGEKPYRLKWLPRASVERRQQVAEKDLIAITKRRSSTCKGVREGFSLVKNAAPIRV